MYQKLSWNKDNSDSQKNVNVNVNMTITDFRLYNKKKQKHFIFIVVPWGGENLMKLEQKKKYSTLQKAGKTVVVLTIKKWR